MSEKLANIMTFRKFISYFKIDESLKELRLNKILDKITNKITITQSEQDFLDNYDITTEEDMMDYRFLSKESAFEKLEKLLSDKKKVICNLIDRDGKIGVQIVSISNNFEDEICIMNLKNREKVKLKDNTLYNIICNSDKEEWSLEMEDEFFEKIPIKND